MKKIHVFQTPAHNNLKQFCFPWVEWCISGNYPIVVSSYLYRLMSMFELVSDVATASWDVITAAEELTNNQHIDNGIFRLVYHPDAETEKEMAIQEIASLEPSLFTFTNFNPSVFKKTLEIRKEC